MQKLYTKITDEYSSKILNWAIKKTGNRTAGEDLSQEVFLQIFIAASKQERIEKLENFIWKTAHYVWCNYVRALAKPSAGVIPETLPDGTDFARDYADNDELQMSLYYMRRKIANLSSLQRKIVIFYYLDGLSVRDVAQKLETTESAITWHLFDARKKVKKELKTMKNESSYVYSPGKMGISASVSGNVPKKPDTDKINDSLIRQNLCLLCCGVGKTIDELTALTGIPKPYLEYDIDWLNEREFLLLDGKRYHTSFIIINRRYFEYRKDVYQKNKTHISGKIIDYLSQNESAIREIGFMGSDFPLERLLWPIITMFINYVSSKSELFLRLKSHDNCAIHADGGKYHVMASDKSDDHATDVSGRYDNSGWEDFWGIWSDSYENGKQVRNPGTCYWLGVYNFVKQETRPEIVTCDEDTRKFLHKLYCNIQQDSGLNVNEREKLAEAVESGLISKNGNTYITNFTIFTKKQLATLQEKVYAPLLVAIKPKLDVLAKQFSKNHRVNFPNAKEGNINYHTYLDLWMFGIFTLMFGAEDNKICIPHTPEEGALLTLVLIK
ncbi:MAG: RNA polymerase sigma factor [Defluviitaleaceae bacterium]|nr:RNA polymerase sigma factor [Defluviitaleaceae bacterium]